MTLLQLFRQCVSPRSCCLLVLRLKWHHMIVPASHHTTACTKSHNKKAEGQTKLSPHQTLSFTAPPFCHPNSPHRTVPHCNSLYHTIPHCNSLYHTVPHCKSLYHNILHCTTYFLTVPHCTSLHHIVPYSTTLYHTVLHSMYTTLQATTLPPVSLVPRFVAGKSASKWACKTITLGCTNLTCKTITPNTLLLSTQP